MSRVKKIKNEKKLANFEKALPSVLATSSTKKIIRAASKGNLEEYGKTFKEYNWARTRDYNCVLLIFSPIVAAAQAIANEVKKRNSEEPLFDKNKQEDEKWITIIELLNKCLSNEAKLGNLCNHIGSGKGKEIEQTLRNFQDYNNLIGYLVYGDETKKSDPLIKRSKNISSWKVNGKYIRNKLVPFVNAINPKLGEIMKKSVLETNQVSNAGPTVEHQPVKTETSFTQNTPNQALSPSATSTAGSQEATSSPALNNYIKQKRKELIEEINKSINGQINDKSKICAADAIHSENATDTSPFLEGMQFHYAISPAISHQATFGIPLSTHSGKTKKIKLSVVFTDKDLNKFISMDLKSKNDVNEAFSRSTGAIVKNILLLITKINDFLNNITTEKDKFEKLKNKEILFVVDKQKDSYVYLHDYGGEIVLNCRTLFDSEFDDDGKIEEKLKKIYSELESLSKTLETQGETPATTPPSSLAAHVPFNGKGNDTDDNGKGNDTDDNGKGNDTDDSGWGSDDELEDEPDEKNKDSDTIEEQKIKELAEKGLRSKEQLRELSTKLKAKHTFSVGDILDALELFNSDKNYEEDDIIEIFEIKHKLNLKNLDDAIKLFEATKRDGGPLQKFGYGMINTAADLAGTSIEEAIASIERIFTEHNDATTFLSVVDTFVWSKKFEISKVDAMKLSLAIRSKEFQSIIKVAPTNMSLKTKTMELKDVAYVAKAIIDLNLDAGEQTKKALSIIVYLEENKINCNLDDAIKVLKYLIDSETIDWININNAGIDKAYREVFEKGAEKNLEAVDALKERLKKQNELNAYSDDESSMSDDDWLDK